MHLHVSLMCPLPFNSALSRFMKIPSGVLSMSSSRWPHSGDQKIYKATSQFFILMYETFCSPSLIVWFFNLNLSEPLYFCPRCQDRWYFSFVTVNSWKCDHVCVCLCLRLCHHVCEGKVRASKATCRPGKWMRWEVVSKVVSLFVYVLSKTRWYL